MFSPDRGRAVTAEERRCGERKHFVKRKRGRWTEGAAFVFSDGRKEARASF